MKAAFAVCWAAPGAESVLARQQINAVWAIEDELVQAGAIRARGPGMWEVPFADGSRARLQLQPAQGAAQVTVVVEPLVARGEYAATYNRIVPHNAKRLLCRAALRHQAHVSGVSLEGLDESEHGPFEWNQSPYGPALHSMCAAVADPYDRTSSAIEITWNAGSPDASAAVYEFRTKAAAEAFVFGAEQALGDRTFEVRHLRQMVPPQGLRELADHLHAFWYVLPESSQEKRAGLCVHFLKALGVSDAFEWHSGGGFCHALAGVEVEGCSYVVWTGIDACGVNPCVSLKRSDLVEAFGNPAFGEVYEPGAAAEGSSSPASRVPNIG